MSDKILEKLAKALNVDIFQLFIPLYAGNRDDPELILYDRLMKLRAVMKEDIDKRLDQFYLSDRTAPPREAPRQ